MEEVWKPIFDFPRYFISNLGRVRSTYSYKILKLKKCRDGYLKVCLCKNKSKHYVFVHRLVANAFIANPNRYPIINHKDENKANNCYTNLEWCTHKYNNNYGNSIIKRINAAKTKRHNKMLQEVSDCSINIKVNLQSSI